MKYSEIYAACLRIYGKMFSCPSAMTRLVHDASSKRASLCELACCGHNNIALS